LRNPGGYQFGVKVEERRDLLWLILKGSKRKIEAGFATSLRAS